MNLKTLEENWSSYLASENCPPVLGLVPLTDDDSKVIQQLVTEAISLFQNSPLRVLFALLEKYPASISVWLARAAGEAYEAGAFWEKFSALTDITIPPNSREEFANRFCIACQRKMDHWVPPTDLGGHNIVAQFLHQAGLPLDRCGSFAQHIRKVERSLGLPELDDPEAGEQLREAVLDSLMTVNVPTLKRALRGPAGPRICEAALNVVVKGAYTGINPRLGRELERVFESAQPDTLRRSAHQPFLRLGEDLSSIEVVGPKQDTSLVSERGLMWIVDGRRYPTPRTEEFVATITDRPRITIELAGLVYGNIPLRTFVLRLNDLAEPFMLFDERTRRQRRTAGPLPPGNYWLLHRTADSVIGGEQTYEWPEDDRALSLITIRPGFESGLESDTGGPWRFSATLTPFIDPVGRSLNHESGDMVYFDWEQLPFVWFPATEAHPNQLAEWRIHLRQGDYEHSWGVTHTGEEAGGMAKCRVESGSFLTNLSPGMHRLEILLRRGGRTRVEGHGEYWLWQGLHKYNTHEFQLDGMPENLIRLECRGFAFAETAIRHLLDQHRRHTLVFKVDDEHVAFHWAQPGVFLESHERGGGQQAKPCPHNLGSPFSASLNSFRWLKIWLSGQPEWEVLVAGRSWLRSVRGDTRDFVELSLASLALAFPTGGDIMLRTGGYERLVARFSSPLKPVALERVDTDTHTGYKFKFPEQVSWVRPQVRDLASRRRFETEGQRVDLTGQTHFITSDLPEIKCTSESDPTFAGATPSCDLTFAVPRGGWPEGFWMIELEVRRDEQSEWERAVLGGRQYAPVIVNHKSEDEVASIRAKLFWNSFASGAPLNDVIELDEQGRADLFELLTELIALRQWATAAAAQNNMGWLKDAVRSLSQLAGRMVRQSGGEDLQVRLLNLACQDVSHAGFVHLPGLLALPGADFRELPSGYPLNDALRRCGWLATADTVSELVRNDFTFFDLSVIGCFANFAQIAAGAANEAATAEFNHFNHEQYWRRVLGILDANNLAPDWSGEKALGKAHLVWALSELVGRYEQSAHKLNLGAANALLRCASAFRLCLRERLATQLLMAHAAWDAPWPQFKSPDVDFLEAVPRFTSLFALAARAAAAGWLNFDETLLWLEGRVPQRWMAEEGIAVLVTLAPELFGNQLLFWELVVRTAPHRE